MKLRRFLLRYYPPGIILEYEQGGELRNKPVDLLTLTPESDLEVLVNQVVRQEALISENRKPQLRKLLCVAPPPLASRSHRLRPATDTTPSLQPNRRPACIHTRHPTHPACTPTRAARNPPHASRLQPRHKLVESLAPLHLLWLYRLRLYLLWRYALALLARYKLVEKIESHENQNFYLFKILRA